MPRVLPDQRSKFEDKEFFRKLSRKCEIKYTGFRDRPHEERQARFQNACGEGCSEIAFVATGSNLSLQFFPASWQGEQRQTPSREYVDLEREAGKQEDTTAQQAFEETRRRTREFEDRRQVSSGGNGGESFTAAGSNWQEDKKTLVLVPI
ncbi:hypothetical protein P7K49_028814 [Saguinus oedipus]|uniref:Core-binding factor subunit beta n=1 Tax=Saguinus oedipus TaxID=9490 RepID=A0ABQ9U628_SAGOE|nr:hypothetical protein P7K49_028814 [Saguinus oedipus]